MYPDIPEKPDRFAQFYNVSPQVQQAQGMYPQFNYSCKISRNYLKKQFPQYYEEFANRKNQEINTTPKIVCNTHGDQKIIVLTPCMHVICKLCILQKFHESIQKGNVDRNSLVCDKCQSYINHDDIRSILVEKPELLRDLEQRDKYCCYQTRDECPKCNRLILYDVNHSNQKCLNGCNFEFCKDCLLTTHQGKLCKDAVKEFLHRQRKVKLGEEQNKEELMQFYNKSRSFGICPQCKIPARRMNNYQSQFARCKWCKKIFCSVHGEQYNGRNPCCGESNLIFLISKNLAIKG